MIQRIIYEDWPLIFPTIALLVAAMVYAAAAWRTAGLPSAVKNPARSPRDQE